MKAMLFLLRNNLLILALCFITGTASAQGDGAFDKEARLKELKEILSLRPMLKACELKVIEEDFPRRVFSSAAGAPLKVKTQRFNLSSFMSLIGTLPAAPALHEYIMIMHYGLDGNDELVFGVGFTTVSLIDFKFAMPSRYHMIDNNGDFDTGTPAAGWIAMYGVNYYAPSSGPKVYIKRDPAGAAPYPAYDPTKDTRFMIMDLDRVMQFIVNNTDASRLPLTDRIAIVPYAHVLKPNQYHHGVALAPLVGNTPLADDLSHAGAGQFHHRVLDLGSPCPENCDKVDFRYEGAEIICPGQEQQQGKPKK